MHVCGCCLHSPSGKSCVSPQITCPLEFNIDLLLPWPATIAGYSLSDVCGYIHMYMCVPQLVLGKAHIDVCLL